MLRRVISPVALVTAMALLVAGCASEADDKVFTNSRDRDGSEEDSGGGEPGTPDTPEAVAGAATQDIVKYWEQTFPEIYGGEFEELANGFHPYGPESPPPSCGPYEASYEQLANNAFYCDLEDFIAWDEAGLLPWLEDQFDLFTIAVVLAHEVGHAVQQRVDELDRSASVRIEMQADCFAGAWAGWVADGNADSFSVNVDQLDEPIAGLIAFRDPPGISPTEMGAHGAGFDRVGAFQDGYENGAERCAEYPELDRENELVVTQIPFTTFQEAQTEGNLHLEDLGPDEPGLYTLAEDYLEIYYDRLFEDELDAEWEPVESLEVVDPAQDEVTCNGETLSGEDDLANIASYCEDENVAVLDGTLAPEIYEQVGDFAVGAEMARLWAISAQEQLDVDPTTKEARLQADCLAGNWAAALWPRDGDQTVLGPHPDRENVYMRLSAGDLDEAVMGFIIYDEARRASYGNVFERTAEFRKGFYNDVDACGLS